MVTNWTLASSQKRCTLLFSHEELATLFRRGFMEAEIWWEKLKYSKQKLNLCNQNEVNSPHFVRSWIGTRSFWWGRAETARRRPGARAWPKNIRRDPLRSYCTQSTRLALQNPGNQIGTLSDTSQDTISEFSINIRHQNYLRISIALDSPPHSLIRHPRLSTNIRQVPMLADNRADSRYQSFGQRFEYKS